ncbi:MAG: 30S ribosomal protein S8 [bacterium]|nr:30S ribosomal protein S8 [bacterium]
MMTDPLADALTRVRNALRAGHPDVVMPHSRLRESVLKRLLEAGYFRSVETVTDQKKKQLVVIFKYTADKKSLVTGIERVSRPGSRIYKGHSDIQPLMNGLGLYLISTPQGILTDSEARQKKLGGEILCRVW